MRKVSMLVIGLMTAVAMQASGTILIDADTRNGDFDINDGSEVTTSTVAPVLDLGRPRALHQTPNVASWISIDSWTVTRNIYPGGNNSYGFDAGYGLQPAQGDTAQVANNSGAFTVDADQISYGFNAGNVLSLSFDLGSDTSGGTAPVYATASLIFDAGLGTEWTYSWGEESRTLAAPGVVLTDYVLPSSASTVDLSIALSSGTGGTAISGIRTLMDNVEMSVIPEPSTLALIGLGLGAMMLRRRR